MKQSKFPLTKFRQVIIKKCIAAGITDYENKSNETLLDELTEKDNGTVDAEEKKLQKSDKIVHIVNILDFIEAVIENEHKPRDLYFYVDELGLSELTIKRYMNLLRRCGIKINSFKYTGIILSRTINRAKLQELIKFYENIETRVVKVIKMLK